MFPILPNTVFYFSSSSSSSSSSESTSLFSFFFFFLCLMGWSRNSYIRCPQLLSPSNYSSWYSTCSYPSLSLRPFNLFLPNWLTIMWVISSVRKMCLKRVFFLNYYSLSGYSGSEDRIVRNFAKGAEWRRGWWRIKSSESHSSVSYYGISLNTVTIDASEWREMMTWATLSPVPRLRTQIWIYLW